MSERLPVDQRAEKAELFDAALELRRCRLRILQRQMRKAAKPMRMFRNLVGKKIVGLCRLGMLVVGVGQEALDLDCVEERQ